MNKTPTENVYLQLNSLTKLSNKTLKVFEE